MHENKLAGCRDYIAFLGTESREIVLLILYADNDLDQTTHAVRLYTVDMYLRSATSGQRWLKSACLFSQSDHSLRCPLTVRLDTVNSTSYRFRIEFFAIPF